MKGIVLKGRWSVKGRILKGLCPANRVDRVVRPANRVSFLIAGHAQ